MDYLCPLGQCILLSKVIGSLMAQRRMLMLSPGLHLRLFLVLAPLQLLAVRL